MYRLNAKLRGGRFVGRMDQHRRRGTIAACSFPGNVKVLGEDLLFTGGRSWREPLQTHTLRPFFLPERLQCLFPYLSEERFDDQTNWRAHFTPSQSP
jgi:hypothetical protein